MATFGAWGEGLDRGSNASEARMRLLPIVCLRPVDENRSLWFADGVHDSVLVREPVGEEPGEVTHKPLSAIRILRECFEENLPELELKLGSQRVEIFDGNASKADLIGLHVFLRKSSSMETVFPVFICLSEVLSFRRNPGTERRSRVSTSPS